MRRAASFRAAIAVGLLAMLGACATSPASPQPAAAGRAPTPVDKIEITEGYVSDRPYKSLGEVSVRVDKLRNLNFSPTRAMVDERLRVEAAKLGADAVIQVRYRDVGVTWSTWGHLDGRGRAVVFDKP
jgi:hypothetical protein